MRGLIGRMMFAVATVWGVGGCADAATVAGPDPLSAPPAVLRLGWFGPGATALAPVLAGAGDIARCYEPETPHVWTPARQTMAEQTARLLDGIDGTVMALGDNAYEAGSLIDYYACYHPTWGRHRSRTRPAVGNHEYITPGAAGYFAYFGSRAAPPLGYYSYDIGSWHVVVLNSMSQWTTCQPPPPDTETARLCAGDRLQQQWLRGDLAAHSNRCTAAYFHHPRFSSGLHGSQREMQQMWDILYDHGVDVVVAAHDHLYERFAPQDRDGNLDEERGIRQFVVGTGGAELYSFTTIERNSEVRNNDTHGVLKLTLGEGSYQWAFVPVAGQSFSDEGSGSCH
jgi:hypothetical protein